MSIGPCQEPNDPRHSYGLLKHSLFPLKLYLEGIINCSGHWIWSRDQNKVLTLMEITSQWGKPAINEQRSFQTELSVTTKMTRTMCW